MGWIGWGVVAAVAAAACWGYRQLRALEVQIRREIEEENAPSPPPPSPSPPPPSSTLQVREAPEAREEKDERSPLNLAAERLLRLVRERPGMLQTEVYAQLPEIDRRFLQEQLRSLAQDGRVRREKERGTYRVFPAD